MTQEKIAESVQLQRDFFMSGTTKSLSYRMEALRKLLGALGQYETRLLEALQEDLGKSAFEGYTSELGLVRHEIKKCLRGLPSWGRPRRRAAGILNFPAQGWIYPEPYGIVLVIAPWNYPLNLCLMPLVGAIAAGNCVCLKTSEFAPHTSRVLAQLLGEIFHPAFVQVVEGRAGISEVLLKERFDFIFFTGSSAVGKKVMHAAAEFLTPVTLELGGKSPCLVCDDCDLQLAARRIVWGKLLNAGQTCVAPDYILVSKRRKGLLVQALIQAIRDFWGKDPLQNPDYPRIIHARHFQRLMKLVENSGRVVFGGEADEAALKLSPTILEEVSWESPVMQEEIFGPIFPVLSFQDVDEMIAFVRQGEKPLALYVFTEDRNIQKKVMGTLSFGGGCINDTVMHLVGDLPFGGVGNSGMGHYHGKASFETFSHEKSILQKSTKMDVPLRYPPYKKSLNWVRKLF